MKENYILYPTQYPEIIFKVRWSVWSFFIKNRVFPEASGTQTVKVAYI